MKTFERRPCTVIGLLAVVTVFLHLLFGVYYAASVEKVAVTTLLRQQGGPFLASHSGWNTSREGDAAYYNRTATNILRSGLPRQRSGEVTWHAPLYSYFLAGCYAVGGVRFWPVAAAQAVLSGLTALALGTAAKRIGLPQRGWIGPSAALLYLINLRIAMYVGYIYPTLLALALFAAAVWLASSGRPAWFVVLIVLGMAAQASFFVVAVACAVWLLLERNRLAALLLVAVAVLRIGVGMVTPKLSEEKESAVLWEANNPYYESMRWNSLWERRPGNPWTKWSVTAAEQQRYDQYLARRGGNPSRAALLWIRENPAQYVKLCLIRLRTTLGPFTGQMSPRNRAVSMFYWLMIFPLGVYGLWCLRHLPISRLALCVFLVLTAFETLVITEWYLRYRMPVDLLLMVYAAVGIGRLLNKRQAEPLPSC
jgi:hypothetical protein